jgi:hypothetical protein
MERPTNIYSSLVKRLASEDNWMEYEYHYTRGIPISKVSQLFNHIWAIQRSAYKPKYTVRVPKENDLPDDRMYLGYSSYEDKPQRELEEALNFSPAFQESILIWHVATVVFLVCSQQNTSSSKDVQATLALSNYMVFLVAVRPSMLPGLKLRSLYEAIHQALEGVLPSKELSGTLEEKMKKLAKRLTDMEKIVGREITELPDWKPGYTTHRSRPDNASSLYDVNIILSDGTSFALALLSRLEDHPDIRNQFIDGKGIDLNQRRYKRLIEMFPELSDTPEMPMYQMKDHLYIYVGSAGSYLQVMGSSSDVCVCPMHKGFPCQAACLWR